MISRADRLRPRCRAATVLVAMVATVAVAACGSSGEEDVATAPPPPRPLGSAERAEFERLQGEVRSYCSEVGRFLAGERRAPTRAELDLALRAIDDIAALARENPRATLPGGGDLRLALGDIAEDLEGTNCSFELVDRADQALATIP